MHYTTKPDGRVAEDSVYYAIRYLRKFAGKGKTDSDMFGVSALTRRVGIVLRVTWLPTIFTENVTDCHACAHESRL